LGDAVILETYPEGFEKDDELRSNFIRELTLMQISRADDRAKFGPTRNESIPKRLLQYWHDPADLPDDVRACLSSWDRLGAEGFECLFFDDAAAGAFIYRRFGPRESTAFERCRHPAMRSDFFRMCFILAEGGLYVDADDVLISEGWRHLFTNRKLKIQPLCYDVDATGMLPTSEIWNADLDTLNRIFYVNNNPIAAPAGHPVLRRALQQATDKLLSDNAVPEIQSTTGPGNLTEALAAHAHEAFVAGAPFDFDLITGWDDTGRTKWDLSYRGDARNWRNMDGN
tara:strand:+ start:1298 stop:2149 length:852 start_codon:yes stop_codon:yes gene_type:complete